MADKPTNLAQKTSQKKKRKDKITYIQLVKEILQNSLSPLTVKQIWQKALEKGLDKKLASVGKTPTQTIWRIFVTDKNNFDRYSREPVTFGIKGKKYEQGAIFNETHLANNKKIQNSLKEKDLHPILVKFLFENEHFNTHSKTINHNVSIKDTKGAGKWLHPDIVAIKFPFDFYENYNHDTLNFLKTINYNYLKYKLFSFELKLELNFSNLRQSYFQAVSNSSWANEAYLVVANFDVNDIELLDEIRRLNNSFGVGLIKLDLDDFASSGIIMHARHNQELDLKTFDLLVNKNRDFSLFINNIKDDINSVLSTEKIDRINTKIYDKVLNDEEYTEYIKKIRK